MVGLAVYRKVGVRLAVVLVVAVGCKARERPPSAGSSPTGAAQPAPKPGNGTGEAPPIDPMYPTPIAAGTDKIFLLEEPDRGPTVPVSAVLPAAASLTWTSHAFCEVDFLGAVCSPMMHPRQTTRIAGNHYWRIGTKANAVVVAEKFRGAVRHRAYWWDGLDTPTMRRLDVDIYGHVSQGMFAAATNRYSQRLRNGSNALAGCGMMAITRQPNPAAGITSLACLQWNGEPMHDTDGVASTRYERDRRGFIIRQSYFGVDGQPTTAHDGVAVITFERDGAGRMIYQRFRDIADQPVANIAGCFGEAWEHGPQGAATSATCIDARDQAVADADGISTTRFFDDNNGCDLGHRFVDSQGKPTADRFGVHAVTHEVDAHCAIVRLSCFDKAQQPIACGVGEPASTHNRFDRAGNLVVAQHFDAAGKPSHDGLHESFELRHGYDAVGNNITTQCFDDAHVAQRCPHTEYSVLQTSFDAAGRVMESHYLDVAGLPTTNFGSFASRFQYDNYDHRVAASYVDRDGQQIAVLGAHRRRDLFDAKHRRFGIVMDDGAGGPADYTGCFGGVACPEPAWHAVRIVRRVDGSVDKNLFFNARGVLMKTQPCATVPCFE